MLSSLGLIIGVAVVGGSAVVTLARTKENVERWFNRNPELWSRMRSAPSFSEAAWLLFDALNANPMNVVENDEPLGPDGMEDE